MKSLLLQFLPIPAQLQRRHSPVVTYHACFSHRPPSVAEADNISPERLFDQVSWLKRHYRFVTIDEFCQAKHRRGMAAVTFDDGYKSAIDNALPVLQSLGVPCTIFVNTASLEKKTFWRHKVVYILQEGLAEDCARSFFRTRILKDGFYRDLKHPTNNSRVVEQEIDAFLSSRELEVRGCDYLMDDRCWFRPHPLVWYGNHSHSHYVLSSLSRQEQIEEIGKAKALIATIPGIQTSEVFSLPFGEAHHWNDDTLAAVKACGYQALLMNQGGVNGKRLASRYGLPVVERFSPYEGSIDFQLKKEICRSFTRLLWI